jgi:hypothetical protein
VLSKEAHHLRWLRCCRRVQETQEQINALQESLKRLVAEAEAARMQSAAALRRQTTLREVKTMLPVAPVAFELHFAAFMVHAGGAVLPPWHVLCDMLMPYVSFICPFVACL